MISINYSGTEVYVDGEKIDEYGFFRGLPFGRLIGNMRYLSNCVASAHQSHYFYPGIDLSWFLFFP